MANLSLYIYEFNGCYILKRVTYRKASKFANTFCFIDDLCVINKNSEFEKSF